jgi:hypothetical protein
MGIVRGGRGGIGRLILQHLPQLNQRCFIVAKIRLQSRSVTIG